MSWARKVRRCGDGRPVESGDEGAFRKMVKNRVSPYAHGCTAVFPLPLGVFLLIEKEPEDGQPQAPIQSIFGVKEGGLAEPLSSLE